MPKEDTILEVAEGIMDVGWDFAEVLVGLPSSTSVTRRGVADFFNLQVAVVVVCVSVQSSLAILI